ncbi:CaiB/BaiF CoA transferase family protein [Arthrobacter sp. MMS18-M83]|uniref:CaiB/BaiF CoA transferase family protein n=1 Tax=Arthrobacter sp. MMS18-M83 TaxID=2996261 RepID=UPI00227A899D|nr:CaiB/BaiF CoA-transferase family protein [Arthrobacter sp. MMS18-M83]WAH96306.1 CaiB/BaiF CoA-transferase family protein [Arthrobacter sp. MMS18-M83]
MGGVLEGLTVVEFAGLGPAPFCCMLLADMGAEVIRVERPQRPERLAQARARDTFGRGRQSVVADLKDDAGKRLARELAVRADVLVESFRPGVMERLGLGPEDLMPHNPALVYARMTGWGQDGPLAATAGHDINYIAMAGALEPMGRAGQAPVVPLSLVGDFGGGGMFLALGIVSALYERSRSGKGQIVDASCVDGASMLMSVVHHMRSLGQWRDERGTNLFDTGAPYYDVYETADGLYVSFGAVEPKFYEAMVETLGLDPAGMHPQNDRAAWPRRRSIIAERIRTRTRTEWGQTFDGVEACFAPVLSPAEVPSAEAHRARKAFVNVDGFPEPAPSPRFSRTPSSTKPRPEPGGHTAQILERFGLAETAASN